MSDEPGEPRNFIGGAAPWVTRNAPSVEVIKAAIVAELLRQREENPYPDDLGWLDIETGPYAVIDGHVDLNALAAAVQRAIMERHG